MNRWLRMVSLVLKGVVVATPLCPVHAESAVIKQLKLSAALLQPFARHAINMDYSRAYLGRPMRYQAVKMKVLLSALAVKQNQVVELIANDDFAVFVPAQLFFLSAPNESEAYLAIEPTTKWPLLKNGTDSTAGPYQVLWTQPQRSHISDEYWAWSVTAITIHNGFPSKRLPPNPRSASNNVQQGHAVFISHCASCHSIEHHGQASIGPDLSGSNRPFVNYPTRAKLKAFIRNPKQFRPGRMSGSSHAGLSEHTLEKLVDYLAYIERKHVVKT